MKRLLAAPVLLVALVGACSVEPADGDPSDDDASEEGEVGTTDEALRASCPHGEYAFARCTANDNIRYGCKRRSDSRTIWAKVARCGGSTCVIWQGGRVGTCESDDGFIP